MVVVKRNTFFLLFTIFFILPIAISVSFVTVYLIFHAQSSGNMLNLLLVFSLFPLMLILSIFLNACVLMLIIESNSQVIANENGIKKTSFGKVLFMTEWDNIVEIGVDKMHLMRPRLHKLYFFRYTVNEIYISLVQTNALSGMYGIMGQDLVDLSNEVFITLKITPQLLEAIKKYYQSEILMLSPNLNNREKELFDL